MYAKFVRRLLIALYLVIPIATWADATMLCPGSDKPSPLSISGKYPYKHTPFEWNGKAPEEGTAESFLTLIKKNVTPVHRSNPKDKWSPELSVCGCSAGICVQTIDSLSNMSN